MTPHNAARRRGPKLFIIGSGLAAALALTGCSQGASPEPKSAAAGSLPGEHVHGISRDPGSGKVNLATHEGLFVSQTDGSWQQVGPVVDLMSFAVTGPGSLYASGHPAEGVDLPAPVGLIKSTDAGRTRTVMSLGGQSDFHALAASTKGVRGFDGALKVTSDGKSKAAGWLNFRASLPLLLFGRLARTGHDQPGSAQLDRWWGHLGPGRIGAATVPDRMG